MHNQSETLNIGSHRRQLVLKALQKYRTIQPAAAALGISERTLIAYKKAYEIKYDRIFNNYFIKE